MMWLSDDDLEMESKAGQAEQSMLVRFYLGEESDSEGRFLRDIRGWDARRLERVHDYIQWLFPTRQRSQFNPNAPLPSAEDVRAFREDRRLRTELIASLRQMLAFYGFGYRDAEGERPVIEKASDWTARSREWFTPGDHNLLRITRILDCLSTFGLAEHARVFLASLEQVCTEHPGVVGGRTLEFWRAAVRET